jgi:hypothetical protein
MIKRSLIALAMMTAPAYAAGPITLDKELYVCRYYKDWDNFEQILKSKDRAGTIRFMQETAGCGHLPAGTVLYSDRKIEDSECVRIEGQTECYWSFPVVFIKTGEEP